MLKTTAQQLLERTFSGDLGTPLTSSAVVDQATATLPNLITVPRGQVFLMTSIQLQADPGKYNLGSNYNPSPALSSYGYVLTNEAGSGIWAFGFLSALRQISDYHSGITPTALSAPPGNVVVWRPKYAIPVPGGFRLEASTSLGDFGNHSMVHGILVDQATAATLGYNLNAVAASSRHHITTSRGTSSATTIITGRTGKSIRLLDVHVRLQPIANSTNTLTIQQVDGQKIFQWTNSNVVDLVEQVFSPDELFLKPGQGLQIQTTVADTCSFTVSYEFVDQEEVPKNVFFACLQPNKPTPTETAWAGAGRKKSTQFTLYYPRTGTTGTTPGVGKQHLVRGIQMSAQKGNGRFANSLQTVEMTLFAISQGASAGNIGFSLGAETQSNAQVSPTLFAGHHDQCVTLVADSLCVPCKPNDGALWFDSGNLNATGLLGSALTDPTTTDADITAWSATVWGRTIDTRYRQNSNRGG